MNQKDFILVTKSVDFKQTGSLNCVAQFFFYLLECVTNDLKFEGFEGFYFSRKSLKVWQAYTFTQLMVNDEFCTRQNCYQDFG